MVRRRSVWTVTALTAALALPAVVAEAMGPADLEEAERRYVEGQDHYANGDYVAAGDRWTELLALLPENEDNRPRSARRGRRRAPRSATDDYVRLDS